MVSRSTERGGGWAQVEFCCDRAVNRAAAYSITAWQTPAYLTAFPFGFALYLPAPEGQSKNFAGARVLF